MKIVLMVLVLIFIAGCSSVGKDGEKRELKKEYIVVDAKYERYPGWINEPVVWASKNDKKHRKYRYFVSTTGLIKNKRLCMKSAEAQANATIAGEISQFIKNSYAQSVQGNEGDDVEQYMEDTLAQEIQSFLVGAAVFRKYWEKRVYKVELGAEVEKRGLVCSALMKMKKKTIEKAINKAMKKLIDQVSNPESKKKVEAALDDVAKKFE